MNMHSLQIGEATLYCADTLQILPRLSGIDAVITDPPYNSGGAFSGSHAASPRAKYLSSDSSSQALPEFSGDNRDQRGFHFWSALWTAAALRASRSGAVMCVFSDWRQLPVSTDYLQAGGWVWRGIVPWVKPSARPQIGRFTAACEYVVWGSAGALPPDRSIGVLPVFYRYGAPPKRVHITQKPVDLMSDLLRIVPPGSLVLDPFMGSGTTGVAAVRAGHRFIGIEYVPEIFESARQRIQEAVSGV